MLPEDLQGLSSVIDHKALLSRCLNNLQFAERILTMLETRGEAELAELERALVAQDKDELCRVAHRMQGACANAAAFGLQRRASELRQAVREGTWDDATQSLEQLRQEWTQFTRTIAPAKRTTTCASF